MSVKTLEARLLITGQDKASAQIAAVTKASNGAAKALEGVGRAAKASAEVERLNRQLEATKKAAAVADSLTKIQGAMVGAKMGAAAAAQEVKRTGAALDVARAAAVRFDGIKAFAKGGAIAREMQAATQAVREHERAHKSAQATLRTTEAVVAGQTRALHGARSALNAYGVPVTNLTRHQGALRSSIEGTTAAIRAQERAVRDLGRARETRALAQEKRQAQKEYRDALANRDRALRDARSSERREAAGTIAAGAGVIAAHKGKQIGLAAIESASSMDYAVRQQHISTDVTEAKQQSLLLPQAKRIGQETKFSNEDIVKAQTATIQSLPIKDVDVKAEVGAAIVDQVRNQAVILEAGMTETAETVRAFLQSTNKDISTKAKAVQEATRATNLMVKGAKLGGSSAEDVSQFIKFGVPTGKQAGFSDETMFALQALARRGGLRGDEAGVFMRAAASKLIAPTQKGREAEIVAGIDRSKYTTPGKDMSVDSLAKFSKNRFGKDLNEDQRSRINDLLEDPDVVGDSGEFTKQISSIVAESFDKKKNGKTKAQDAQKIAKMVGDFYKMSVESTDVEGLLIEHLTNPRMTAQLRNAFYTDKHGGKAGILATHGDQFGKDREALVDVTKPENADFAAAKARYKAAGLGGAIENLKGSWETLVLNIGTANAGLIKFSAEGLAAGNDMFSNMSTTWQQIATFVVGGAAVAGGVAGTAVLAKRLLGLGALSISAVALNKSAVLLDAAAVKLMGGSLPDKVGDAAKVGAGATAGAATFGLGGISILGGAVLGGILEQSEAVNAQGAYKAVTGQEADGARLIREHRDLSQRQKSLQGQRLELAERLEAERGVAERLRQSYGTEKGNPVEAKQADAAARIAKWERELKALDEKSRGGADAAENPARAIPSMVGLPNAGLSGPITDAAKEVVALREQAEGLRTELGKLAEIRLTLPMDESFGAAAGALETREREITGKLSEIEARMKASLGQAGTEAGNRAGTGIGEGLASKTPEVLDHSRTLFQQMQEVFSQGIRIPISFAPGEGFGAGGGGQGGFQKASYDPSTDGGFGRRLGSEAGGFGGLGASGGARNAFGGSLGRGDALDGPDPAPPRSGATGPRRGARDKVAALPRGGGLGPEARVPPAPQVRGAGGSWYDAVIAAEGTAARGGNPYDTVLGYGRWGEPSKPLTDMTLDEVHRHGLQMRRAQFATGRFRRFRDTSSASGAFQIVGSTMRDAARALGLDGATTKFTPETQRLLADWVRRRQGFRAWEGFKRHPRELARARAAVRAGDRGQTAEASTTLPEIAVRSDRTTPEYRAFRAEQERLAQAGQLPAEDADDAAAFKAWRAREGRSRGLDGAVAQDLGGGRIRMPDGRVRSKTYGPALPDRTLPEGSGPGGAADRMERAAERMEGASWRSHHTVEVTAGPGLRARTTGMDVSAKGPVRANVGVSMPQTKEAY